MTTITIKSKGISKTEVFKSLDKLRKYCQEFRSKKNIEVLGVSFDTDDEKAILVNNKLITYGE